MPWANSNGPLYDDEVRCRYDNRATVAVNAKHIFNFERTRGKHQRARENYSQYWHFLCNTGSVNAPLPKACNQSNLVGLPRACSS